MPGDWEESLKTVTVSLKRDLVVRICMVWELFDLKACIGDAGQTDRQTDRQGLYSVLGTEAWECGEEVPFHFPHQTFSLSSVCQVFSKTSKTGPAGDG